MAFPGEERIAFEKERAVPLARRAGPGEAGATTRSGGGRERLAYAGNEAARRYLDGEIDAPKARVRLLTALRDDAARTGEAARRVHRPVPQLRDQLQPRPG